MIIPKGHPFIAALTCTYCGDGLLEVKSLHHVRDNKPTVQNLDYSGSDEDSFDTESRVLLSNSNPIWCMK